MFIFRIIGKFLIFLLVVILAIPTYAIARTWLDANNEKIEVSDAIVVKKKLFEYMRRILRSEFLP
ncbi:MAG: hypothetical protein RL255_518 [Actinomycetota bacterium]